MAFSFGSNANAAQGSNTSNQLGPELEVIQTEGLGFLSIAGDAKVRLTSPWSPLPISTASLLGVASRRGLVAAAGPDGVTIATTASVRKAFESVKVGDSDVRDFQPQLKIPLPMRVAHLAFTADEKYLVLSAESGGGLAVYEVQTLLQGGSQTAFELATNGESLRALIPNPTAEKAELCALVSANGSLYMANLAERKISAALKSQVSCISWSTKGKQLVAGLADGTIHQMTPEGDGKAEIPRPPGVENCHGKFPTNKCADALNILANIIVALVSSLTWLENNLFLAIHTSTNESPPTSVYHIITRQPPSACSFQKITDPVDPFGSDQVPHISVSRLKDFPPSIQDVLILSSTASPDIGLLTRSKTPLASDKPAESITGVFTTTEMADDSRRATLPMSESMENTIPVGTALDLSSTETVYKPIPTEEMNESPTPVPGFWVLTNEGVLCSWWVIYSESVKQGTTYPGMTVANPAEVAAPSTPAPAPVAALSMSPARPAFGSPANAATATPAFGGTSSLGTRQSPWGAPVGSSSSFASPPAATSTPAFGKPSTIAFGQSAAPGVRSSPWGTAGASSTATKPAFGQSTFGQSTFGQSTFGSLGSSQGKSPFGSTTDTQATAPSSTGGFASFASKSGFASVANANSGQSSIFGAKLQAGSFASGSSDLSMDTDTAFPPKPKAGASDSPFGSTPFKLESSFKPDPSAKDDDKPDKSAPGTSLFGSAFGSALGDASKPAASSIFATKDKDSSEPSPPKSLFASPLSKPNQPQSLFSAPSTTPTTTPAPKSSIFGQGFSATTGTSLFGSSAKPSSFGSALNAPEPPKFGVPQLETPKIKLGNEGRNLQEIPLPPESTSKMSYPLGDSSSSASTVPETVETTTPRVDNPPLPPDFLATPKAKPPVVEDAPLPPDFLKKPIKAPEKENVVEEPPLPPDPRKVTKPLASTTPEASPLPPSFLPQQVSKTPTRPPPIPESETPSDLGDDDLGSDDSGEDIAKDLSPPLTSRPSQTPGLTPQSSFGMIGGNSFSIASDRPRALFSNDVPVFEMPHMKSPRSPSPVRGLNNSNVLGVSTAPRRNAPRSVSAPSMASQILGGRRLNPSAGMSVVAIPEHPEIDPAVAQQRKTKARQEAEETQPLVDEDDDEIQRFLTSEVEGSLDIDEFIAHTDVAPPAHESIPSQVEAVYRDINSMIDTLGLNARSVTSFVKGHFERLGEGLRTPEDLEIQDDWVLCELEDLSEIIDDNLAQNLDECRIQDVELKKLSCADLSRNMSRLRAKQNDMEILLARLAPGQGETSKAAPLSAEQAVQQNELRRDFAHFSTLLSEAEEALTILKTKVASANISAGKTGGTHAPTVDAVMRTINKMTNMVEKRSGAVDVLENQMRKLRFSSVASNNRSREGSPMFMTPQKKSSSTMFSPEPATGGTARNFNSSIMSLGGRGTPTRKKMSGFGEEEKVALRNKRAAKRATLDKLKSRVEEKGVSVWTMEDLE